MARFPKANAVDEDEDIFQKLGLEGDVDDQFSERRVAKAELDVFQQTCSSSVN